MELEFVEQVVRQSFRLTDMPTAYAVLQDFLEVHSLAGSIALADSNYSYYTKVTVFLTKWGATSAFFSL